MRTDSNILIYILVLFTLINCSRNDNLNPYDPGTPKSYWTPDSFKITQLSYNQLKLTWIQTETNIEGFKIDRRESSGEWQIAVAILNKNTLELVDNIEPKSNVNYEYRICAYAGNNLSNFLSTTIQTEAIPNVITNPFYLIKSDVAIGSGNLLSSSKIPITSRGICYNIDSEPTISKDTIQMGMGQGLFKCNLTELIKEKTYYIRAYCITSLGVVYGNTIILKTSTRDDKIPNMDKVLVEGGTFTMGDDKSTSSFAGKPEHTVSLSNYYISKYEVTVSEFCIFLNEVNNFNIETYMMGWRNLIKYSNSLYSPLESEKNLPVSYVSWQGIVEFCNWAGGRLPTEAEWEFAAKGGTRSTGYKYSGSNDIFEVGWSLASTDHIQPVGLKKANELGLYDMSGNVSEMCSDWYDIDFYKNSPTSNPQGPASGTYKVLRGGSINMSPIECTLRFSTSSIISWGNADEGFRIVFNPK